MYDLGDTVAAYVLSLVGLGVRVLLFGRKMVEVKEQNYLLWTVLRSENASFATRPLPAISGPPYAYTRALRSRACPWRIWRLGGRCHRKHRGPGRTIGAPVSNHQLKFLFVEQDKA